MAEQSELRVILRTVAQTQGAQQTSAALRQVSQQAAVMNQQTLRAASGMAAMALGIGSVAAAGVTLTNVLGDSIKAAADSERVARATAAAYGAAAQQFERFAASLATQTGFTSQAILEAALSARTLSANYGLSIDQTQKLIRASADLARVRGIGVAESFERVQSAIRGEAEASEFLGLTLNDTFVKNNAMNGSLRNTFERMTDAQKAQVRYTELLRQTATFSGLATSATNSLDGSMQRASSSANALQLALGRIAAPAVIGGLQVANQAMKDMAIVLGQLERKPSSSLAEIFGAVQAGTPTRAVAAARAQEEREQARLRALNDTSLSGRGSVLAAEQRDRDRVDQRTRRLRELNENLPALGAAQGLARVAILDQVDAATRDLINLQEQERGIARELADLRLEEARATLSALPARQEMVRLEREAAAAGNERLRIAQEARRLDAERRGLPAQFALEDSERQLERARLVAGDLSQAPEARSAAIREAIGLQLRVLPGQRLAAFDALSEVRAAERAQRVTGLGTRAAQLDIEGRRAALTEANAGTENRLLAIGQAAERTEMLASIAAGAVANQHRTVEIILKGAVDVTGAQGGFTPEEAQQIAESAAQRIYAELMEGEDQASFPPVIQVSGVRRRP